MNNSWKKEGLINGTQGLIVFGLIMACWVLLFRLCENLGISPAWGILVFFASSIFTVSFSMAKVRYDIENKTKERNK